MYIKLSKVQKEIHWAACSAFRSHSALHTVHASAIFYKVVLWGAERPRNHSCGTVTSRGNYSMWVHLPLSNNQCQKVHWSNECTFETVDYKDAFRKAATVMTCTAVHHNITNIVLDHLDRTRRDHIMSKTWKSWVFKYLALKKHWTADSSLKTCSHNICNSKHRNSIYNCVCTHFVLRFVHEFIVIYYLITT